ncbi:hypothetical protein DC522_14270 [Microvirga sp. KLBC 81]|nr:hypothetical protein DC522_14270 [Microvirga sp. KLBC 81]
MTCAWKLQPSIAGQFQRLARRPARSLMSRACVGSEIAERVIGHAIPGVTGVYDRHGYVPERSDALQKLAAEIGQINA